MHVRAQLRRAVAARLAGLPTTATRVYASRVYPFDRLENLPGLAVYCTEDAAEVLGLDRPTLLKRSTTVVVEGFAQATAALDDTLDAIAAEVETALATPLAVGGVEIALDYQGASTSMTDDLEQPVGQVRLEFTAQLITLSDAPEQAL